MIISLPETRSALKSMGAEEGQQEDGATLTKGTQINSNVTSQNIGASIFVIFSTVGTVNY